MNIQEFCKERPYLYHLTDRQNLPLILDSRTLLSTTDIAQMALSKEDAKDFLRSKRNNHLTLSVNGINYKIRDQNPILLKVLERSLTNGMRAGEFIELLNKRVFWWPTVDRLTRHFNRYVNERPIILRVSTVDMLELNKNVELCHLNSGATRCHPAYGGNAPTRGEESFLAPKHYDRNISSVAEVTFVRRCKLPEIAWISSNPSGTWRQV